jgi:hypothetical protein
MRFALRLGISVLLDPTDNTGVFPLFVASSSAAPEPEFVRWVECLSVFRCPSTRPPLLTANTPAGSATTATQTATTIVVICFVENFRLLTAPLLPPAAHAAASDFTHVSLAGLQCSKTTATLPCGQDPGPTPADGRDHTT